ncbi:putative branched-chain amino acid permease (azaleucine resistance) [Halobacteroides halobius DSM 5150]|uniref:Putative branched-chain amino acid permease (Azaleucine resistance) n=1 Tax=Halobacteroides halobius (strain ATCC 35273 / DSM 5150 / MD-1) TaxID=748449 RepID=L0K722_HALHC|nr:AzlC family ABC transporter permease [Halobacteroides halobius]AGB41087.1 putative branched-chain amino acid permease (azaleucine resistance) [Halobacteroides halobius DSM 5150]
MKNENSFTKEITYAEDTNLSFSSGLKKGIPIALGYIPIAIAFGLVSKSAGIPNSISILMSLLVFAGASQFIAVNLLALQTGYWEIVMTTFIINLRHFLMSASISQKINKEVSQKWRAILAFGITDETFSVASLRPEKELTAKFLLGLNLISYSAWVLGTAIGVFLGASLPEVVQNSMGIALYVMFIGLLIPSLKKSKVIFGIFIIAIIINSSLYWIPLFSNISTGWSIIITTLSTAMIGAIIFPTGVDRE